jgi:hypothetical protein
VFQLLTLAGVEAALVVQLLVLVEQAVVEMEEIKALGRQSHPEP